MRISAPRPGSAARGAGGSRCLAAALAGLLLSGQTAVAEPIVILESEFDVFGDDYTQNVVSYTDGLVNAVRGQEGGGFGVDYSPTRFRAERDVTDITYFVGGGGPDFSIQVTNTEVDHRFGASFDSIGDRDAWESRLASGDFESDLVTVALRPGLPLFIRNNALGTVGLRIETNPVVVSEDTSPAFDALFDDGPRDSSFVEVRFDLHTTFSFDTFLVDDVLEDLFGPLLFDYYADLVTGLDLASAETFLAERMVTAVDIDWEFAGDPLDANFADMAVDLTYWLPDAGVDPLLAFVGGQLDGPGTLISRLRNGIPPFNSDVQFGALSVTSGRATQPGAPVPEPGTLLLVTVAAFLARRVRSAGVKTGAAPNPV